MKFNYKNHPVLGYRVHPDTKIFYDKQITKIMKKINSQRIDGTKIKKNAVFIMLLQTGINNL